MFPDHFVLLPGRGPPPHRAGAVRPAARRDRGATCTPRIDTDELRASHADWSGRVEDHAFLCSDPSLRNLLDRAGVHLIGFRELRDLQRAG